MASDLGFRRAHCRLGWFYNIGLGVAQDYKEAAHYYTKAARLGCASSQNNLGVLYELGQGVQQSYKQALYYYKLSAKQNNLYAKTNIERCSKFSIGRCNSF
jgi:TPR repeat protein